MAPQVISPEKRFQMSLLLDAYGELLTEKQSTFLRLYYEEDHSYGEIAADYGVSRQAIFDAVKHGEATLRKYERVLEIVRSRSSDSAPPAPVAPATAASIAADCAGGLAEIAGELRTDADPLDPRTLAGRLDAIRERLERLAPAPRPATARPTRRPLPSPAPRPARTGVMAEGPEVD